MIEYLSRVLCVLKEEEKMLADCEKNMATLTLEANNLALNAERKNKLDLIRVSNEKRKRASNFLEESQMHKNKIQKLEEELAMLEE